MESKYSQIRSLSESRFSSVILLFRLAGIPFKMKKKPTLYSIYMITVNICSFSTFLGMFVDLYIYRDNLRHAMTNIRVLIGAMNVVWIWCYCR